MDPKFFNVCQKIGSKYAWIQGTGGNISIKTSGNEMLIKASGTSIAEINNQSGLVRVDFQKILESKNSIMEARLDDSPLRPSMEAGFHALLGKTVIHTHPSSLCIFACMKNGEEKLRKMLEEDFVWVPYVTPGQELSLEIKKQLNDVDVSKNLILILENHGLVVSSENIVENLKINERIIGKMDFFVIKKGIAMFEEDKLRKTDNGWKSNHPVIKEYLSLQNSCFVFPDAVVFGKKVFEGESKNVDISNDMLYKMTKNKAEKIHATLSLHMYLLTNILKLGYPKCLTKKQENVLLNMEEEKYRKKVLK